MKFHPVHVFDNSAKEYRTISAHPLAAAMGAEIRGARIDALREGQLDEIEQALYRHKMIFFRDQDMDHGDQEAFTRHFGEFGVDAYTHGTRGHPNVQPVIKEASTRQTMVFGSRWHTDSPFMEHPPSISTLYGVDIPPYGGDTMWCNTVLAYATLSPVMQQVLKPLKVHMSAIDVVRQLRSEAGEGAGGHHQLGDMALDVETRKMVDGWYHPIVRTHPVSNEKALYVEEAYSQGIQGMSEDEAEALLSFLRTHVTQPAFSCRLRWAPGTFVVWDNRICIHQAFNDYDGFRREMYRTTVLGEVPT